MYRPYGRRIPGALSLLFLIALAACGGSGGGGGTLPAVGGNVPHTASTASTPGPIPVPSGVVSVSAQITAIGASKMSVQAGPGCGYMYVYYNSSTVYFNGKPQAGQWGVFTGTGTKCSSITATSVSLSSAQAASTTLSGTVAAQTPYGFTLSSNGTNVPVALTSSTRVTGLLLVGSSVSVTGLGTSAAGLTATQIVVSATPTPAPTVTPAISPTPFPSGAPSATPVGAVTPTPAPVATIPLPTGVLAMSGQITAVGTTLTVQAGAGCGYMRVYVNSGTVYLNGNPAVGQYAEFTGTGAKCSTLTANTVWLSSSPPASVTTTGTVAAQQKYGFTLNTGTSTIPVAMSSSTVVYGAALTVGSAVTVTGLGTTSSAITATQIAVQPPPTPAPTGSPTPTPGPIAMTHVLVSGYIYGYAGTPTTVPINSIAPYVDWAQTSAQYIPTLKGAGIKTMDYVNFWRNYTSDNPQTGYVDLAPGGAHAGAEAKDCNGNVLYDTTYGGGYESDARTSSAVGHAQVVINNGSPVTQSGFDAVFSDDAGAVLGMTPCNYDEAGYDAAVNAVHSALGIPIWVNALGGAADPSKAIDLAEPSNVLGAMCESCYGGNSSNGDYVTNGNLWLETENAEIGMAAQHKVFWDYARMIGDPSSETALRVYVYGSFLLGYDPKYAMFEEAFKTASGLPVMPETGLVAENPVTTQTSIAGYAAPGGSYFREFADCYYRGSFVSSCAVAVNPTTMTVPVPTTSYAHSLVLSGSDVLEGGTASFSGAAPTQLAPGAAVILFR